MGTQTTLFLLSTALAATYASDIKYPLDGRVTPCWKNASLSSLPFCDSKLPAEARATDLVSHLLLEEKLAQLANSGANWVPRLGVDLYQYHSEGLHGVRTSCNDISQLNTTEFPQVTGIAATGNKTLIRAMATVVANEARALNNVVNGTVYSKGTHPASCCSTSILTGTSRDAPPALQLSFCCLSLFIPIFDLSVAVCDTVCLYLQGQGSTIGGLL